VSNHKKILIFKSTNIKKQIISFHIANELDVPTYMTETVTRATINYCDYILTVSAE
jgi:hypothetical protein